MSASEVRLASITTPHTVHSGAAGKEGGTRYGDGGASLLFSDTRIALLMLNEARYRVVSRLFGVPRDQSSLVTIIALGTLAAAVRGKAAQAVRVPSRPSGAQTLLGGAVLKEPLHLIAGASSRDLPSFGPLIAIGILGASFGPALRGAFRGVKAPLHTARADFDHRYGHLVRSNRRPV